MNDNFQNPVALEDLSVSLGYDVWNRAVADKRYLIRGLGEPAEAAVSKIMDWIPKGMRVRFNLGPEGKIEHSS